MPDSFTGLDAYFYDQSVPDWPGELEFYPPLAAEAQSRGQAVLEVARGTGRIAARLAQSGVKVTGMDLSQDMLDIAAAKSLANILPNIVLLVINLYNIQ